ncbi:uncharacterized protein LOC125197993 [Salvia hispanica]|uniref:uncharacterized protein LOC125197807 n=1 Tax=Salvia hispanica TaxID=49212 RepID=UPI0020091322|nr:uncharacterized protein LOC125197807 [Salvia hispanica]XP_047952423.1 uncharacterized protein LOC125197993 [Salvia hispanica]
MAPDLNNAASPTDREKQKNLDQEVREMISTLTSRLGSIQRSQKSGSSSSHAQADDDEQGMRMITLAGTNLGATMRGDLDDKTAAPQGLSLPEQEESASYVVNSNFQAINNSIMLGGSYKTNDPGVHLDITDYVDHNDGDKKGKKSRRGGHGGGHHHGKRSDNLSDTESEKN